MLLLSPMILARLIELNNLESIVAGFGDGSDGEITSGMTIDPGTDDTTTVVIQATSVNLPAGQSINITRRNRGLIILCQGDCHIAGTIDQTGKGAKVSALEPGMQRHIEIPVGTKVVSLTGGGNGGNGGRGGHRNDGDRQGGNGASGTNRGWFSGGWGGAGGGGASSYYGNGGHAGGSNLDAPIGSGGTGGRQDEGSYNGGNGGNFCGGGGASAPGLIASGGGGAGYYGGKAGTGRYVGQDGESKAAAGGGTIILVVQGRLTLASTAVLRSNGVSGGKGGNGGDGGAGGSGGGGQGGGGGGCIVLLYRGGYTNAGSTIQVNAGAGGARGTTPDLSAGQHGVAGTAGTVGQIIVQEV